MRTFWIKKEEKMPDILHKTERKMTTIDVGIDELEMRAQRDVPDSK